MKRDWTKYTLAEIKAIVDSDPLAWGAAEALNRLQRYVESYIKYENSRRRS